MKCFKCNNEAEGPHDFCNECIKVRAEQIYRRTGVGDMEKNWQHAIDELNYEFNMVWHRGEVGV